MQRSAYLFAILVAFGWLALSAKAQEKAPTPPAVAALEKAVVEAIAKAEDSVVAIARVRLDAKLAPAQDFDLRGGPMSLPDARGITDPTSPDFTPQEYGTGVVIDRAGLVVTAYHVLGDIAKNEYYVWTGRKPYLATVLAADPWLDLAVLKIDATDLTPIEFGDAKTLKKGQFVIALGNPYALARDGDASAKWGIVSNLDRRPAASFTPRNRNDAPRETLHHYGTLIETDAILERGTSGGPLINLQGQMVGLTTTYSPLADEGDLPGLAIPVDQAFKDAVAKLKTGRKAEFGFLGVATQSTADHDTLVPAHGAVVAAVESATPAASLDLEPFHSARGVFDVITHVDSQEVANSYDLIKFLGRMPAERRVRLTVAQHDAQRIGKPRVRTVEVTLSKKRTQALRPAYATVVDPVWRGLTVEYATATPSFFDRTRARDPQGAVGLLEVERNSPAWKAGLRPGMFLSHIGDTRVKTPAEFQAAVRGKTGAIKVRVTEAIDDSLTVVIPAP